MSSKLFFQRLPMFNLVILLFNLFLLINTFKIKLLKFETAQISHSGPTNNNIKDYQRRNKRAAYFRERDYDFNNQIQNNNWANLLMSGEPPNEYLKLWILSEHNRYRQMV